MIRPRPQATPWSRLRAQAFGHMAALGAALFTWGAATTAMAAGLKGELSRGLHASLQASLSPLGIDAGAGFGADAGGTGAGIHASLGTDGCSGFIGYALEFDSMLFEAQTPACSGFRTFDIAFLAVVAMIVIAAIRFRHATTRRRLELASRMVEKGLEPPPELVGGRTTSDLRRGLVLVSTGIGLTLASLLGGSAQGISPAGLIPGFIGLGYLVSHRFAGSTNKDRSPS